MKSQELEYRMYGLVPYNLSPIQQGIQYGHAVVEYMLHYGMDTSLDKWSKEDKTFIILNGGTTNNSRDMACKEGIKYKGSLNTHLQSLKKKDVKYATFHEPDLGDQLTAVVFLVDERVWDKKKYPDFRDWAEDLVGGKLPVHVDLTEQCPEKYQEWLKLVGGEKNVWMREFLSQFRLA